MAKAASAKKVQLSKETDLKAENRECNKFGVELGSVWAGIS